MEEKLSTIETEVKTEIDLLKEKAITDLKEIKEQASEKDVEGDISYFLTKIREQVADLFLKEIGASKEKLEEIVKKGFKNQAIAFLRQARKEVSEKSVNFIIENCQKFIEKAGISLKDIDTSKEELEELEKEGYKNDAIRWVKLAKEDALKEDVSGEIENVKMFIEKAGISLKDIDTSKEELEELEKEGYKNGLNYYLGLIRTENSRTPLNYAILSFRKCVKQTGVSLEEIKTSEEEIEQRIKKVFGYLEISLLAPDTKYR